MGNYSVLVIDFETTGLSPDKGDRAIEIGAVLIQNNQIVDRFQSLINPEMRISSFIAGQIPPAKPEACKTMDRSKRLKTIGHLKVASYSNILS
ncbi:MAG: exonuclease domain-containing protein [Desulfatirhabdiaceae bacterium]